RDIRDIILPNGDLLLSAGMHFSKSTWRQLPPVPKDVMATKSLGLQIENGQDTVNDGCRLQQAFPGAGLCLPGLQVSGLQVPKVNGRSNSVHEPSRARSREGSAKRQHKRGAAEPPQLPQPLISAQLNPLTTQEDGKNSSTNCTVECATAEAVQEMEHAEDDGLLISRLCTILTPPEMSARPSSEMEADASAVPAESLGHEGAPLEETTCQLETASDIQFSCCFCNYVTREQRGIVSHLIADAKEQHLNTQHCPMSFSTKQECSIRTMGHMHERPFEGHLHPAASHENGDLCSYEQVDTQGKSKCQPSPMSQSSQERIAAKKVFQCPNCPKTFLRKQFLVRHKCIHTGEKPHKCPYCRLTFARSSTLIIHVRTHTAGKPSKCQQCNETFATSSHLARHSTIHTMDKPFKCQLCPSSFAVKKTLEMHIGRHHTAEKPHRCHQCNKTFASRNLLFRHIARHRFDRPFECQLCPSSFALERNLREHIRRHTGEKPFKCQHCNKAFHSSSNLITHTYVHIIKKPYKCPYCPNAYTQSGTLEVHVRMHTGEKPYRCWQCKKAFTDCASLTRHANTHIIEKPFKCQLCPMSFSAQPLLSIHMQGHKVASRGASVASEKGDRPFKCLQCPKAFSVRSRLTIHMQGHNIESHGAHTEAYKGDRPYKCLHCPKAFDWSTSLAIHIRTHTGEKPHKC
ncbi:unnamed protein product, partial [Ixodes pacificus]